MPCGCRIYTRLISQNVIHSINLTIYSVFKKRFENGLFRECINPPLLHAFAEFGGHDVQDHPKRVYLM